MTAAKRDEDASSRSPQSILMGRIGAPFGVRGHVTVHSFTEIPEHILDYQPWVISNHGRTLPSEIAEIKSVQGMIRVRFKGCDDRTQAQMYTNADVHIDRSQLPAPASDEFYWADLEDLSVFHQDGRELGKVNYLFNAGAHDVLVVTQPNGKMDLLIPMIIPTVVISVDLANQKMVVDWDLDND
jgi:16S rRNA processing protein RimM